MAANQIYDMLIWIEQDFKDDCARNPEAMWLESPDRAGFVVRNTSRTLSYVNQACLLEGMLVRSYEEAVGSLQVVDPSITLDADKMVIRAAEIAEIKKFRNKVAAHTTYSKPGSEDNLAQELKSLLDLVSTSYDANEPDSFRLGAMSIIVGGIEAKHKPQVAIREMHPLIMAHVQEWLTMFKEACDKLHPQLPKTVDGTVYSAQEAKNATC